MTWWTATNVAINNGQTIVNVVSGDDVQIAQESGGIIIGNNPPVEIKRTFLDGTGAKKIELRLPWPYSNVTSQSAVAFPTDADLAEATRVLRAVGSDAVTFAEALSQVVGSNANSVTVTTETSGDLTVVPYGRLTQQVQALLDVVGDFGSPLLSSTSQNDARNKLGLAPRITAQPTLDLDFTKGNYRVYEPFGLTKKPLTEAITTTRASVASYNSPFGVAQAAANIPRIEYNPTTGECLGLLVEERRTNMLLWSEQFDNAYWIKNGGTSIVANADIAPDGTLTADRLINATQVGFDNTFRSPALSLTQGTMYTGSIYMKSAGATTCQLRLNALGNSQTSTIALDNTWKRVAVTAAPNTAGSSYFMIGAANGDVLIWGSQLEAGSFPTSYIKTEGTAVTRVADNNSVSFLNRLNMSEGTLFFDYECLNVGNGEHLFSLTGSIGNFTIRHRTGGGGNLNLLVGVSSGDSFSSFNTNTTANLPIIGKNKLAVIYKSGGDYKVCVNGVIGTFASTRNPAIPPDILTNPILTLIRPTSANAGRFTFNKTRYYPRALSDQELIDLTRI